MKVCRRLMETTDQQRHGHRVGLKTCVHERDRASMREVRKKLAGNIKQRVQRVLR